MDGRRVATAGGERVALAARHRSRRRALAVFFFAALALGACSGGGSSVTEKTTLTQPLSAHPEPPGPQPSLSARMVCESEARQAIAGALGLHETKVTTPSWHDHVYVCTYVYPRGSITLSVKEFPDLASTGSYYDALLTKLGRALPLFGLGQGGFLATNGDAVVRKDYKVLLVDVQAFPDDEVATMNRSDVAEAITTAIMGCWSGA